MHGSATAAQEFDERSDRVIFMESEITATRAARRLSDVINRVQYRGESFVVVRGGERVARIQPVGAAPCTFAELAGALRLAPRPGADYLDVVESVSHTQPELPESSWER
jgi:prevent-host-death family protein